VSIAVFALGLIVATTASPQGMLRVSAIPDEAPAELQRKFAPLGRYLEQRTGMTVQFVPATDYAAVVQSLATGRIDLAWLGGFTYVQAMETTRGAVVALVQRDEDQQFTSKFVTTDPTIRSFTDLRGKTFAFGSQDSTSGHLMPRYFLLQAGIQPERDFRNVTYSGAHDATAALVESRKVDAGVLNASIFDKLVEQKTMDPNRVRVFATTPPYHDYNWTVRAGMPRDLVKKLTDAFLELDARNPQHAEILSLQRAARFIPTQPEYYSEIKRAAQAAGLPLKLALPVKAPSIGVPIAASTVLRFPLTEIANEFRRETGHQVDITYGSAGTLMSSGSSVRADPQLNDLKAALADGRIQRFVISNPERSPYGRAARAVLRRAGIWEAIQPKLIVTETAGQAMELLVRGSSQAGIVPLSLAKAQDIDKLGNFAVIPADWHREVPLEQGMVLLKSAGDIATEFYRYMQGPAARSILMHYGFVLP